VEKNRGISGKKMALSVFSKEWGSYAVTGNEKCAINWGKVDWAPWAGPFQDIEDKSNASAAALKNEKGKQRNPHEKKMGAFGRRYWGGSFVDLSEDVRRSRSEPRNGVKPVVLIKAGGIP